MPRVTEVAAELGLPVADVLVVAGQPVPGTLLPPERDRDAMRAFAYRVTFCNHSQLIALCEFLYGLPDEAPAREPGREGPGRPAPVSGRPRRPAPKQPARRPGCQNDEGEEGDDD